jgi:hypothetical protein
MTSQDPPGDRPTHPMAPTQMRRQWLTGLTRRCTYCPNSIGRGGSGPTDIGCYRSYGNETFLKTGSRGAVHLMGVHHQNQAREDS